METRIEARNAKTLTGLSVLRKLALVCAILLVSLPASAAVRSVRLGVMYGPAIGPWGWYDPFYGPYPYGSYSVVTHPNAGLVKLDTKLKDAEVFINGAFAGTAKDFKSVWLRQGSYKLEVRAPGRTAFTSKIYVVNGKTVHVRPDLRVEPKS